MLLRWIARKALPRSLRRQILFAAGGLALLILAGGATALYALRSATDVTRSLADEQLVRMQDAQDLVRRTLLIERASAQLSDAASADAVRARYTDIVAQLTVFDRLALRLADDGGDLTVLDLHQSSQLFRNTINIVAQLRESQLQSAARASPGKPPATGRDEAPFRDDVRQQAEALVAAAQLQLDRHTQNYRAAIQALARTSARNQRWVTALLIASLAFGWIVAHHFLGRHVLARLQRVSRRLLATGADAGPAAAVAEGDDEIGEMARAVEAFQQDRRQLALANQALREEKARQEALIRELAQAHSQLLQSEKMASIGQLAAGVAHEINNPIGFVNANVGTLQRYVNDLLHAIAAFESRESGLPPDARAALGALKQEIDLPYLREDIPTLFSETLDGLRRVKDVVQSLKDFSHVDGVEKQRANLEHQLDSTVKIVWNELKYKVELIREYGTVPEIECMPSQLAQVFMNLLVNAAQSIEQHGRITLRTGHDKDAIWVEIEDTGSGIDPRHLGRIFDPFFTTKPVGVGTGLGLSISYGIVKKHGGRIEVVSEPGNGSRFKVVLPR
ncbi:ATP-binding protein [Ralstonia syzygii]|uniref:ATP-binding protein n=1 Tax=Ralstonia syzygii TaxID=28097 RepID=UPI0018D06EA8|nr:ATP-binding protein [Ralstonia syzygii]